MLADSWTADGDQTCLKHRRTCIQIDDYYTQRYCRSSPGPLQEQLTHPAHTQSQAPRHSRRHRAQSDSLACSHNRLHYIHYSSQRASPPPRCTCAHVSQNTSPPRHGVSSCRPAHLSCAAGHPDLSAVLPPCMTSLAGHEESVEAFFLFSLGFSSSSSFVLAPYCFALWHRSNCKRICTVAVIFSIEMRLPPNSASAWHQSLPLENPTGTRPAHS